MRVSSAHARSNLDDSGRLSCKSISRDGIRVLATQHDDWLFESSSARDADSLVALDTWQANTVITRSIFGTFLALTKV